MQDLVEAFRIGVPAGNLGLELEMPVYSGQGENKVMLPFTRTIRILALVVGAAAAARAEPMVFAFSSGTIGPFEDLGADTFSIAGMTGAGPSNEVEPAILIFDHADWGLIDDGPLAVTGSFDISLGLTPTGVPQAATAIGSSGGNAGASLQWMTGSRATARPEGWLAALVRERTPIGKREL